MYYLIFTPLLIFAILLICYFATNKLQFLFSSISFFIFGFACFIISGLKSPIIGESEQYERYFFVKETCEQNLRDSTKEYSLATIEKMKTEIEYVNETIKSAKEDDNFLFRCFYDERTKRLEPLEIEIKCKIKND